MQRGILFKFLVGVLAGCFLIAGCKKEPSVDPAAQAPEVKSPEVAKYAKYSASVYKSPELKKWVANLSKTEPVSLKQRMDVQIKGKKVELAEVTLSDGTTGFLKSAHLGDAPLVFIEDTKAYVRNNLSSRVYAVIPKGTIGFTVSEREDWTQVYVGKLAGKWLSKQWVNQGFVKDSDIVSQAVAFDKACSLLKKANSDKTTLAKAEKYRKEAAELLKGLENSGLFKELAEKKLEEMDENSENMAEEPEVDMKGKAIVTAKSGLKMRSQPGTDGEAIVLIPGKSVVSIIEKGKEETISDKKSNWYKVTWEGKTGWVFGGFLDIK